jgi:hypothetical protein
MPLVRRTLLVLTLLACNAVEPADDSDASSTTAPHIVPTTDADDPTLADTTTGEGTTAMTGDEVDTHDTDDSPVAFDCKPGAAPSDPFVDCIESFTPEGAVFGQDQLPQIVLGPPIAGDGSTGSVDVLALGCGGEITLYFDEPALVDGPGPDFIVFENPLPVGKKTFVEPARVLVSADGLEWRAFPCDPVADHPPLGCAGVAQVHSSPDNMIDPTDPALAGGDAFDLADVGLTSARYVRLLDVGETYYGARTWCGGGGGGFDLDAIAALHGDTP